MEVGARKGMKRRHARNLGLGMESLFVHDIILLGAK